MSEKISPGNRFIQTILIIDKAMTWNFDSHIHLSDPAYLPDIDFILTGMEHLKIKACCVSMDVENSFQTLNLSKKSNLVLPFVGIHPECATDEYEKIIQNLKDKSVYFGIRPEHIYISEKDESDLEVTVDYSEQLGSETYFYCNTNDSSQLIVHQTGQYKVSKGDKLFLRFDRSAIHLFGVDGKAIIKNKS